MDETQVPLSTDGNTGELSLYCKNPALVICPDDVKESERGSALSDRTVPVFLNEM